MGLASTPVRKSDSKILYKLMYNFLIWEDYYFLSTRWKKHEHNLHHSVEGSASPSDERYLLLLVEVLLVDGQGTLYHNYVWFDVRDSFFVVIFGFVLSIINE